jgi:hypothetical protein
MSDRNRDPNAGNPSLAPGEFEDERGELQRRGARVFGVPDLPRNIPVGIAPPDPMVVVSNFDTRPIGAYDFSINLTGQMSNSEAGVAPLTLQAIAPDGFTAVLRRVRIEVNPPAVMNLTAASPTDMRMEMFLLRDGAPIPNNVEVVRGPIADFEWPTHQVFGMRQAFGILFTAPEGFAVPAADDVPVQVSATLQGTLIPSKSRPPEVEIASDPVLVRIYHDPKTLE